MTAINILLTSPTGYIGGSVLSALLRHPRMDEFNITVLDRSDVNVSCFKGLRVTPVAVSYKDVAVLKNLASQADVVIGCVDTDGDSLSMRAILGGLKQRDRDTATVPILIHTSGVAVLFVLACSSTMLEAIHQTYTDWNIHQLESLPSTQPFREVDIAITDASEEGFVKTWIILPGFVYGIARTRLASLATQNPHSPQIQAIVDAGIQRGQGGVIGESTKVWPHVHIEDLTCLYMYIFDAAICFCRLYTGRNGIYFAENGECEAREIFEAVAKELNARESRPTVFTQSEMKKYTFPRMLGANARARGERIGWKPVHGTRSMLESTRDEVAVSMGVVEANP